MRRGFSLIELLVVIAIIGLLLGIILPPFARMLAQRHFAATFNHMQGMLKTARQRAIAELTPYGLWLYVDPLTDKQKARFVRILNNGNPPIEVQHGRYAASYWNFYADLCETVSDEVYTLKGNVRVARLSDDSIGTLEFNNFIILFGVSGERDIIPTGGKYTVRDPDKDNDEFGDVTLLPVTTLDDYWETDEVIFDLSPKYPVEDLIRINADRYTKFESQWGLRVYDHADFVDLQEDPTEQLNYLHRSATPIILTRRGQIVKQR